jgi:ribulose-phosphate 3-epimerase
MMRPLAAPSLLSADFGCLKKDIKAVESAGARILHLDVMDGHFVPNISFGDCVVKAVRKATRMALDVHLMIDDPARYVESFAMAGADYITFHLEAPGALAPRAAKRLIAMIRKCGCKPGISIKPRTPVESIYTFADEVDLILIMTVEPGFGGQEIIGSAVKKIRKIRNYLDKEGLKCLISVDGGINRDTAALVVNSGAEILVCGDSIFGAKNAGIAFKKIQKIIDKAYQVR